MNKINCLINLQDGQKWVVENEAIATKPRSSYGIKNYIDLVQTILFVNNYLTENVHQLPKDQLKPISKAILQKAFIANAHLKNQNFFSRVVAKVILYISTGSTLRSSIENLGETLFETAGIENDFSATILYPQLMRDAQNALSNTDFEDDYARPLRDYHEAKYPILFHLHNGCVFHLTKVRELIMEGRDFNDWKVAYHCDTAWQIINLSLEITIERELAEYADKEKTLGKEQDKFVFWSSQNYAIFYEWLRSVPAYDPATKKWTTALERNDQKEIAKFYDSNCKQNKWREYYNKITTRIDQTVNLEKVLKYDDRRITGLDTPEILDSDYLHKHPKLPKMDIAKAVRWSINDDDFCSQRLAVIE